MPEDINYDFLSKLEGGSRTNAYVPAAGVSNSGVTIATGFDLGQRNEADLKSLGLSVQLISKLKPFLGKKSKEAADLIKTKPLTIAPLQAVEIDKAVKKKHVEQLKLKYNAVTKNKTKFDDLPPQAQTIISSVSFQYGTGLDIRAPKFWGAVIKQDWKETAKVLNDFGDVYPTRRKKEAELLGDIK